MKSIVLSLVLLSGCGAMTPVFAQATKAQTYTELKQENAQLRQANAELNNAMLKAQIELSTYKENELATQKSSVDQQRRYIIKSIESTRPGMHWDEKLGGLVSNPTPTEAKPAVKTPEVPPTGQAPIPVVKK